MANELHSKSLKELRVLYPGVKSTSKDGFIRQIPEVTITLSDKVLSPNKINIATKLDEGLGDTIEKVLESPILKPITKAIKKLIFKDGEDCGCKERKQKLNQAFKYKLKPRCLTEQEYIEWGEFKKIVTLTISDKQIKYICKVFSEVMNKQYYEPCRGCSPKPLLYMIDSLNVVYDSYETN